MNSFNQLNSTRLPSGKTVLQIKKDAKRLAKATPNLTYSKALDIQCQINGGDGTWATTMESLNATSKPNWKFEPYRNLMVLATNHLVSNKLLNLKAPEDYYESRSKPEFQGEKGYVEITLASQNTIINWCDIGHGEIRIAVWWKYVHELHPQANLKGSYKEKFQTRFPLAKRSKLKEFVGVTCSVDLERLEGTYLQGFGRQHLNSIYTRQGELANLKDIPHAIPLGYQAEGRFRL